MRKLLPALLLFAVACTGPKTNEYQIEGKISGDVPTKAYLQVYDNGTFQDLDSSEFVNGSFVFKGSVKLPEYYMIKVGDSQQRIALFVENSIISIEASVDSLRQATITGSKVHDKYLSYQESNKAFDDKMQKVYMEYKTSEDESAKSILNAELDSIYENKNLHIKTYVKENGSCVLAPYIISRELIHSLDLAELEELTNTVAPELKESIYTKKLLTRIDLLRSLQSGNMAPEFTQNDADGNPINLADFKGKYVLIDFWASWCGPCRRANPTVVEMYKKYNAKGFTVLGVSMDSKKDKWLQAIEVDGLTWSHVSTLEGWANPAGKLYGVNSIPHAVLIDTEGKIVKRGIHADELDEVLGELLK